MNIHSNNVRTCLQLIFKLFYKEGTGRDFMSLCGLKAKIKAKQVKPSDVRKCHNAVDVFLDKVTDALILSAKPDNSGSDGKAFYQEKN